MENFDMALDATNMSLNSQGSAMQENAKYLDSIEGRWNKLKTTVEGLFQDTLSSDSFKTLIISIQEFVNVIGFLFDKFGGLNIAVVTITASLLFFNKTLKNLVSTLVTGKLLETLATAGLKFKALSIFTSAYTGSATAATIATTALQAALTLGLSVAITAVVVGLSKLISKSSLAREETKRFREEQIAQNEQLKEGFSSISENIDLLLSKYDKLRSSSSKDTAITKELDSVTNKLKKTLSGLGINLDEVKDKYDDVTEGINKAIEAKLKEIETNNIIARPQAREEFEEEKKKVKELEEQYERLKKRRIEVFIGKRGTFGLLKQTDLKRLKDELLLLEKAKTEVSDLISLSRGGEVNKVLSGYDFEINKKISSGSQSPEEKLKMIETQISSVNFALENYSSETESVEKQIESSYKNMASNIETFTDVSLLKLTDIPKLILEEIKLANLEAGESLDNVFEKYDELGSKLYQLEQTGKVDFTDGLNANEILILSNVLEELGYSIDAIDFTKFKRQSDETSSSINNNIVSTDQYIKSLKELKAMGDSLSSAYQEMNENGKLSNSTLLDLISNHPDLISSLELEGNVAKINTKYLVEAFNKQKEIHVEKLKLMKEDLETKKNNFMATMGFNTAETISLIRKRRALGLNLEIRGEDELNEIKNEISEVQKKIEIFLNQTLDSYIPTVSKSTKEISLQSDKYESLKLAIEEVNEAIIRNKRLYDDTSSDEEKNRLLLERKKLYEKLVDPSVSPLTDLADVYREDIDKNIAKLKEMGVQVEYNQKLNKLEFKGLEDLEEQIKKTYGSDVGGERIEEINKLISNTRNLREEVKNLGDEYWSNKDALRSLHEETKDFQKTLFDRFKKSQEELSDLLKTEVEKRKKLVEEEYDNLKESIQEVMDEIDKQVNKDEYDKNVRKQQDRILELTKKQSQLLLAVKSGDLEAISKYNDLETKINEEKEKLSEMQSDREVTLRKEALQDKLDIIDKSKKEELSALDDILEEQKSATEATKMLFAETINGFKGMLNEFLLGIGVMDRNVRKAAINAGASIYEDTENPLEGLGVDYSKSKTPINVNDVINKMESSSVSPMEALMGSEDFKKYITAKYDATIQHQKTGVWEEKYRDIGNSLREKYGITNDILTWADVEQYYKGFANGGINTKEGLYALHGTKTKPEFILNYDQMKSFLGTYASMLNDIKPPSTGTSNYNNSNITVQIDKMVEINGNADSDTVSKLNDYAEKLVDMTVGKIKRQFNKSGQARFV